MKKTSIIILCFVLSFSALILANVKTTVYMMNGDTIPSSILTPTLNLVTDYGEFLFDIGNISSITFPEPGKGNTMLKTIYGEFFRGFITNDIFKFQAYGGTMEIRKGKIREIVFANSEVSSNTSQLTVALRNGDGFYANPVSNAIKLQTSYSEVSLPLRDMLEINFEGFGNVLTKILMRDGWTIQGIIKDDFIPLALLSAKELEIVPEMVKTIHFKKSPISSVSPSSEPAFRPPSSDVAFNPTPSGVSGNTLKTSLNSEMVLVKRGSFQMGNVNNESEGGSNEKPVHVVRFTYDFWIGKTEVTFEEYIAYCFDTLARMPDDEGWGQGKRPVINVSWVEAIAFCNWLSQKEGLKPAYDKDGNLLDKSGNVTSDIAQVEGYRLPTEAEWEYAARGGPTPQGTKYSGSNDLKEVGWYTDNAGKKTHPIAQQKPNILGLFDMSGNVWEWCYDPYGNYSATGQTNPVGRSGANRVLRGGSWNSYAQSCRVAYRNDNAPTYRDYNRGFRLARTVF